MPKAAYRPIGDELYGRPLQEAIEFARKRTNWLRKRNKNAKIGYFVNITSTRRVVITISGETIHISLSGTAFDEQLYKTIFEKRIAVFMPTELEGCEHVECYEISLGLEPPATKTA